MTEFDELAAIVRRRRTNLRMDADREIDPKILKDLCELASWAPNHHHTWPWRFAILRGEARSALGRHAASALRSNGITDDARLAKTLTKYLRAPVVLVVGSSSSERPQSQNEDFDSVAAAIQNLLLGATAAGLASFWATPGMSCNTPEVRGLCEFAADTDIRALIYLGWPVDEAPVIQRPEPEVNWID